MDKDRLIKDLRSLGEEIREPENMEAYCRIYDAIESLPAPSHKVQFLVMFKNKALMCVRTNRESAETICAAWIAHKESGKDTYVKLGDEDEVMMFTLSDVCCIKVILSQKDVGVTG